MNLSGSDVAFGIIQTKPWAAVQLFLYGYSTEDHLPLTVTLTSSSAYNGFLRFTSGAKPADLLVASMAAEPFPIHVLVSGARI